MLLTDAASGLVAGVDDILSERLLSASARPIAVALSGGGDSLALALLAAAWARRAGRRLLVLTVDHGLQPLSAAWTKACAATAEDLGADFQALAWRGDKPTAGVPAAARAARHALLADAARSAGARVILMGHTADDIAEAQAMRAAGSTTPDPRIWSPSPAWPQGRGLMLLRPLLGVRRLALRQWLEAQGRTWIDDPANGDVRYARARARADLERDLPPETPAPPLPAALARACALEAGAIRLARGRLVEAEPDEVLRFIGVAAVCAGGGGRLPARVGVQRLATQLRATGAVTATIAGARVVADESDVMICREAGEARRGGLAGVQLEAYRPAVWDGRFEVTTKQPGLEVRRLAGLAARLSPRERTALSHVPAPVRGGLPAIVRGAEVTCPLLAPVAGVDIVDLVGGRLAAAGGLIEREEA